MLETLTYPFVVLSCLPVCLVSTATPLHAVLSQPLHQHHIQHHDKNNTWPNHVETIRMSAERLDLASHPTERERIFRVIAMNRVVRQLSFLKKFLQDDNIDWDSPTSATDWIRDNSLMHQLANVRTLRDPLTWGDTDGVPNSMFDGVATPGDATWKHKYREKTAFLLWSPTQVTVRRFTLISSFYIVLSVRACACSFSLPDPCARARDHSACQSFTLRSGGSRANTRLYMTHTGLR